MTIGGVLLVTLAIYWLSAAIARTLEYRRLYQAPVVHVTINWTPPYAPSFQVANITHPSKSDGFTDAAINARRAAAERINAIDNTEFIPDLWAYRCKICSTVRDNWLDAFECHKALT